ncbi:hypothetical protein BDF20DRAFT_282625 [Mycotypha africana]|uniref:uncharacterized protein n=1 Tax=Mycotypha africana TaxID=64632 RepID=UPI0023015279|nr:uncharacterized protein BDF20DRAFT_282625 [Mycotypha africana]KAI8987683.1 hypothetical protein BDF20DRAFT_282625 [Mycotypha africana]
MPKTPSLILPDSLPGSWLTRSKISKRNKPTIFTLHHNNDSTHVPAAAAAALASLGLRNRMNNIHDNSFDLITENNTAAPSTFSICSSIMNDNSTLGVEGGTKDNTIGASVVNGSGSVQPEFDPQYQIQYQPASPPSQHPSTHILPPQQQQQQQQQQQAIHNTVEVNHNMMNGTTTAATLKGTEAYHQKDSQEQLTSESNNNELLNQKDQKCQSLQKVSKEDENILDFSEEELMQLDNVRPEKSSTASVTSDNNDCKNVLVTVTHPQSKNGNHQLQTVDEHKCTSLNRASQSLADEFQIFMEEHRQIKQSIEDKKKELEHYINDKMEYLNQRQSYFQGQLKLLQDFL